ncbi:hypothetical protein C8R46DRAFT_1025853 [Mycena filopes]|nr:hypothetical protein C8R46DRAFT_1025853 [Mycena filopes]
MATKDPYLVSSWADNRHRSPLYLESRPKSSSFDLHLVFVGMASRVGGLLGVLPHADLDLPSAGESDFHGRVVRGTLALEAAMAMAAQIIDVAVILIRLLPPKGYGKTSSNFRSLRVVQYTVATGLATSLASLIVSLNSRRNLRRVLDDSGHTGTSFLGSVQDKHNSLASEEDSEGPSLWQRVHKDAVSLLSN